MHLARVTVRWVRGRTPTKQRWAVDHATVTTVLRGAGCVAAESEASELMAAASSSATLDAMVARRATGEPLAWITGHAQFCGLDVLVDPGVYVPRWQSERLAMRSAELLAPHGCAVDLCTGSGAIARVLGDARPGATVVATESDPVAAACARRNGVTVFEGSLDDPLPAELAGHVDVLVGVVPYVPSASLHLLPRDVREFEPIAALDGGLDGLEVLATVVARSAAWVRLGGWLLLECGTDQVGALSALLELSLIHI